jgi:hypothetical protein
MIYQERMVTELAFAPSYLSFSALSRLHAILTACFLSKLIAIYAFTGLLACSEQLSSGRDQIR